MKKYQNIIVYFLLIFGFFFLGIFLAWMNPPVLKNIKEELLIFIKEKKTNKLLWDNGFEVLSIVSSIDGVEQDAYFYHSKSQNKRPLLVSLHSWGGNYKEYDSLALLSKQFDYNYLHPNFRGDNTRPKACYSRYAIGDIEDAIEYVVKNKNVDADRVFVVGKSGGGTAALGVYLKTSLNIHSVISWVPITNLEKWYNEGLIKNEDYVEDILKCTSSEKDSLNIKSARERSPMFWLKKHKIKKETNLFLFAGVYDGLAGNVSIEHSIDFYNGLIKMEGARDSLNYVSSYEKMKLLSDRFNISKEGNLGNRRTFLRKKFSNKELVIFEGGHEILSEYTFQLISNLE